MSYNNSGIGCGLGSTPLGLYGAKGLSVPGINHNKLNSGLRKSRRDMLPSSLKSHYKNSVSLPRSVSGKKRGRPAKRGSAKKKRKSAKKGKKSTKKRRSPKKSTKKRRSPKKSTKKRRSPKRSK